MKKIIFLLLLNGIVGNSIYAQKYATDRSVFSDAKKMQEAQQTIIQNTSTSKTTEAKANQKDILHYYFDSSADIVTFNAKYGFSLPEINPQARGNETAGAHNNESLGLLSSDKMGIDALATFIANRFKQEINIAFLNKFRDELKNNKNLQLFFPETSKVFLLSDPYNYPAFLTIFREAFEEDVHNLHSRLPKLLAKLDLVEVDPELQKKLTVLAKLTDVNIMNDLIPVINELAIDNDSIIDNKIQNQMKSLAVALNAVNKGGTNEELFLDKEDLKMFKQPDFVKTYNALFFRQNEQFLDSLKIKSSDIKKVNTVATKIAPFYTAVAYEINALNSSNAEHSLKTVQIQKAFAVLFDAFKQTIETLENEAFIPQNTELKSLVDTGIELNDISGFVVGKKYGMALMKLTDFIIETSSPKLEEKQIVLLKKYTTFIANCLNAKSKEELVSALETSANPVGSYRIKRNSTLNISFNAFAGGFYGSNFKNAEVYGFTAPVGLYFGYGNLGKSASDLNSVKGKSFGAFVSLIDVGAVTAFRLQDSTSELADVSWSNVFAPGAYLSFGFGKCPISLNLGGQMGPELKSVTTEGTPVIVEKEWYWRAAIVVDISLFDLYTKQKDYKVDEKVP